MRTRDKQAELPLWIAVTLVPVFFFTFLLLREKAEPVWLWMEEQVSGVSGQAEMADTREPLSAEERIWIEGEESGGIAVQLSPGYIGPEGDAQRLEIVQQGVESGLVSVVDEEAWPPLPVELKYEQYPISYLYFLVRSQGADIYRGPTWDSGVLRRAEAREKLSYVETVGTVSSMWYHISWYEDAEGNVIADGSIDGAVACFGFITTDAAERRLFQFEKMAEAVTRAERYADSGALTYISNYKNYNGEAPQYHGRDYDGGGNPRNQSAPAYMNTADLNNFVYLEDGTLVKNLGYEGDYVKIQVVENDMMYYVPAKYIPYPKSVTQLRKVIVVDITNQNDAAFEKTEEGWNIVSYALATTGTKNQYADPTPPGYYFLIEKKPQFYYYRDGTTTIDGYAPYVLRFNGGAYIHGVSTSYRWENGRAIDPGMNEYSLTLGTIPLSHKCVRNSTSHANFLYDWYSPGETLVIVIE